MEPRVQLHVPKGETFPIPLKYVDVIRRTRTTLAVLQESRMDDYWNTDSDRTLSETWTGFYAVHNIIRHTCSGGCVRDTVRHGVVWWAVRACTHMSTLPSGPSTQLELFVPPKRNLSPIWKKLMKLVNLGLPTSFLDHVYLGCTQRECKSNESIIEENEKMFESRISAGATEKLSDWEKSHAETVAWSHHMEGHAKKCVERYWEQLYTVSSPCLDDHHVKKEELESVGELSKVWSQIVLTCLYLARIGRLDILWSVNKLARAVTSL